MSRKSSGSDPMPMVLCGLLDRIGNRHPRADHLLCRFDWGYADADPWRQMCSRRFPTSCPKIDGAIGAAVSSLVRIGATLVGELGGVVVHDQASQPPRPRRAVL